MFKLEGAALVRKGLDRDENPDPGSPRACEASAGFATDAELVAGGEETCAPDGVLECGV